MSDDKDDKKPDPQKQPDFDPAVLDDDFYDKLDKDLFNGSTQTSEKL